MNQDSLPKIEVVLPIFNEVRNILPLVEELDKIKADLKRDVKLSYLFVNDGSSDGSQELLEKLFKEREDIRVIRLIHNFGHSAAITCGLTHAEGAAAIVMDADLQDDPSAIPEMVQRWKEGAKTVVAERVSRREKSRLLFKLFYFTLHKINRTLPPIQFGTYCLLDKSVVERFLYLRERNRYLPGLVNFASENITSVKIGRNERVHGKSRVGFLGLVSLAITAFVSFSNTPIRIVSFLGILASAFAFLSGLTIIAVKLLTPFAIPGWASMMTALALTSGIQLFCIGIIGEYVARMYDEVKRRPLFLIDRIYDHEAAKSRQSAA